MYQGNLPGPQQPAYRETPRRAKGLFFPAGSCEINSGKLKEKWMHRAILAMVTVAVLGASMWAQPQGGQGAASSNTPPAHSKNSSGKKSSAKHHHHKHHHKK
jgi:hypothetical protein